MDPTVATPISESSNITDLVVTNGNEVKGLSEMGLKTLPKQYIQPVEERITEQHLASRVYTHHRYVKLGRTKSLRINL